MRSTGRKELLDLKFTALHSEVRRDLIEEYLMGDVGGDADGCEGVRAGVELCQREEFCA